MWLIIKVDTIDISPFIFLEYIFISQLQPLQVLFTEMCSGNVSFILTEQFLTRHMEQRFDKMLIRVKVLCNDSHKCKQKVEL